MLLPQILRHDRHHVGAPGLGLRAFGGEAEGVLEPFVGIPSRYSRSMGVDTLGRAST